MRTMVLSSQPVPRAMLQRVYQLAGVVDHRLFFRARDSASLPIRIAATEELAGGVCTE